MEESVGRFTSAIIQNFSIVTNELIFILYWAKMDYGTAIKINPKENEYFYYPGLSKNNLKDYKGAIGDFRKAIELDPKDANSYNMLGEIKNMQGDKEGACLDWSKAGELGLKDAYEKIKNKCN